MENIYGLIGEKLGHSFSPQIHKLILKQLNLKGTYNLFEVKEEALEDKIAELKKVKAKGVNVTIPYKTKIIKYLDNVSLEAEKIGAINTIDFRNNVLTGYNTDYYGFGAALKSSNIDMNNKSAVILGTGGVSKAVLQYLIDNEVKRVVFVSRNPIKAAAESTKDTEIISYDDMDMLNEEDIIINCTPCGMYPNTEITPVNRNTIAKFSTAVDLIYNPLSTIFLKQAQAIGLKTVNGLYMLTAQAIAAQEIWQNTKIDIRLTEEIYETLKTMVNA